MIKITRSGACFRAAAALLSSVSLIAVTAGAALATPITVTNGPATATNLPAPNTTGGVGAVTMTGQTFTNQGMVGAGRYTATGRDFNNDTLGSFSGMTFKRDTWRRNGTTGQYSGGLLTLPDRGPNFSLTGFPGNFFSNYNGRLNSWDFTFNPYTGAALPQLTTSQSQMSLTSDNAGSFFFRDFNNNAFTGLEPGSNTFTQNGFLFGGPAAGLGAGKISFDPEAVAMAPDGSFYVSDEYQAGIFRFDPTGRLIGYIPATPAVTPRVGGVVNFTTADAVAGQTGRRLNQGLEGLTITPDGKTLWVMLQSATLQDSTLGNDALRNTTRFIGYDISSNATPANPVAEYVMELPVFNRGNTNGTVTAAQAANRTAAQSEILALNGTQFLVLSRDGNGLGNDPTAVVGNDGRPPVYKSVLLIDTTGATNINGTARQTTAGGTVTTAPGVLDTTVSPITPVQQIQLVNLINSTELNRFGISLLTGAGTNLTTISEKWEAMGLLPTLEEDKPQDVFLFVGNDNDFQTTNGRIGAGLTNGTDTLTTYNSGFVNDNMFMVYRLTLPTYVDPLYLEAMVQTAPIVMGGNGESAQTFGGYAGKAIDSHLDALRQSGGNMAQGSWSGWMTGMFEDIDPVINGAEYTARAMNGTIGVEYGLATNFVGGLALSLLAGDVDVEGGFEHDVTSVGLSAYVGWEQEGWFAQASYSYAEQSFEDILRPAAFGLVAHGETDGTVHGVGAKGGRMFDMGGWSAGPVVAASYIQATIDGYTETGAAGGNVTYPELSIDRLTWGLGVEMTLQEDLLPTFRAFYAFQDDDGDQSALVTLASAQSAMATQAITVPSLASDTLTLGLGIQSGDNVLQWHAGYDVELGMDSSDDITHRLTFGVRF
jgi:hypothetical protein